MSQKYHKIHYHLPCDPNSLLNAMMHCRNAILMLALFAESQADRAQGYTSYFIGNATDVATSPQGCVCLMGGAGEDDHAMAWFLERVDGGDVLVLRCSGSDGYNDYLYSELSVDVESRIPY